MKVLHVFTIFGTAGFFDGQFKYLTEKGHEITVASTPDDNVEAFCERNNTRFIPVIIPRYASIPLMMKVIRSLVKDIRKNKYDAVMGHTPIAGLCAMIAAWLCRTRIRVFYRHGLLYTTLNGFKQFFFKTEEQFVSWLATDVIVVSPSVADISIKDSLTREDKIHVIGKGTCGGIDATNKFNPNLLDLCKIKGLKEKLGLKDADIVFGYCGRLVVDKGIQELVEGYSLFREHHPEIKSKLLIVGYFDVRDSLSPTFQDRMKKMDDVVITGQIPSKDMPYFYSLMDLLVFPSHREGFGMCSIEAAAMNIPVTTTRRHGCVDSIVDGSTGYYMDLSPEGVCEAMEKALSKDSIEKMGKAGRKFVLENFDLCVMLPKIAELYNYLDNKNKR